MEGKEFAGYLHQVNLSIKDVGSVDLVAFTDSEEHPGTTILGRYGFFFMIKFEEYKKQIEIEVKPT